MVSSRKDLKLLCNPSCDFQNLFRLGAAINFDRYANENSLPPPPAARRLAPARSACRGFISFDLKPKQKDTRRCLFVLATNAIFDTGCIGLQSCIEMQPKKHMQPTDKLEFDILTIILVYSAKADNQLSITSLFNKTFKAFFELYGAFPRRVNISNTNALIRLG